VSFSLIELNRPGHEVARPAPKTKTGIAPPRSDWSGMMGQLLEFKPRPTPAAPAPVAPVVRTTADDDHEAALWMEKAELWGWSVKEFLAPDTGLSGYLLHHVAAGEKVPLYTLVRSKTGWRSWDRQRQLTEFETLDEALESVFPAMFIPKV
jgi:hypothetical protein